MGGPTGVRPSGGKGRGPFRDKAMRFIIADTFPRSLEKLDGESQKLVKQAAFEFQLNPASPGFKFHKLERCKDKRFSSARVNRDIRIIVHRDGAASLMLCYVDHHDAAYAWAERRMLDIHPNTGAIQLVEVEERVEEVVRKVVREQEAPLFAQHEPDYLLSLGVPPKWLDAVRLVGESGFLELAENLPSEVSERLLQLADGKPVPRPTQRPAAPEGAPVTQQPKAAPEDPYAHPDSRMHFRVMDSRDDLARALDAPWEQWLIFLHPDQQRYAEQNYKGPARIYGGAGTGKTVVAVHRAVNLARKCEEQQAGRVLLTTYTRTLAQHLRRQVDLLAQGDPAIKRLEITHLHGKAANILALAGQPDRQAPQQAQLTRLLTEAAQAEGLDKDLVRSEFHSVVDAQGLTNLQEYLKAPRTGRGTPLGQKQRRKLWAAMERVLTQLEDRRERTWNGLVAQAIKVIEQQPEPPYQNVIVDESQDFGPAELRFIRALASPGENDIFLCGDEGQRIYKPQTSWAKLGLPVSGRSHRLKVNYRTTAQIRRQVDLLLPKVLKDGDGEDLVRGTISSLSGPEPELCGADTPAAEIKALAQWLRAQVQEGIAPERIAVFARSLKLLQERVQPAVAAAELDFSDLTKDAVEDGTIAIGTMHRAKGLEFRAVAVVGCDEKLLPSRAALSKCHDDAEREELLAQERNLLYVACTRARERLRVSWAGKPTGLLSETLANSAH